MPSGHKYIICPICRGEGSHVNPNIDAHGLSREDFLDDPDFAADYFNGIYDITCTTCLGRGSLRQDHWERRKSRLKEAADARELRSREDGVWESGLRDYRYG